jgi:hypothetical protein
MSVGRRNEAIAEDKRALELAPASKAPMTTRERFSGFRRPAGLAKILRTMGSLFHMRISPAVHSGASSDKGLAVKTTVPRGKRHIPPVGSIDRPKRASFLEYAFRHSVGMSAIIPNEHRKRVRKTTSKASRSP